MTGAVHPFLELIRARVSIERFDARRTLSETEICGLIEDATLAPSSFNIQHWRFVAVRTADDKQRLQECAYGQQQVADAAVTFIILGDTRGVEKLPEIMDAAVENGLLPRRKASAWVRMAREIYADENNARDEALRSGSLVAMVLMLVAQARGLVSGALSGFDAKRLKQEFEIPERYVPVMLLAVGYPADSDEQRKPRLDVGEVLMFDCGGNLPR